jgi:DNA-binding MarR family transcriptional regulator
MENKYEVELHDLWHVFRRNCELVPRYEEVFLTKYGKTNEQFKVLLVIIFLIEEKKDYITLSDLVPYLGRTLMSVSSIIDRMVKYGLIEKNRDLLDRRALRLSITEEGKEYFNASVKYINRVIAKVFDNFSIEELQALNDLSCKLKKNMEGLYTQENILIPQLQKAKHLMKIVEKYTK